LKKKSAGPPHELLFPDAKEESSSTSASTRSIPNGSKEKDVDTEKIESNTPEDKVVDSNLNTNDDGKTNDKVVGSETPKKLEWESVSVPDLDLLWKMEKQDLDKIKQKKRRKKQPKEVSQKSVTAPTPPVANSLLATETVPTAEDHSLP